MTRAVAIWQGDGWECVGTCGRVWGHVAEGGGMSQGLGRAYCRGIHQM